MEKEYNKGKKWSRQASNELINKENERLTQSCSHQEQKNMVLISACLTSAKKDTGMAL